MNTNKIVYAIDKLLPSSDCYTTLRKEFKKYKGLLHSIKLNSMIYTTDIDELCLLSTVYDVPLFFDLKLYDTPITVYNTIANMPPEVKYITVTFASHNHYSIEAAAKASYDFNKEIFIVSVLTSSITTKSYIKNYNIYLANNVVELNKKYESKLGMVVPADYVKGVKAIDSSIITLTPGLAVNKDQLKDYKKQYSVGLVEEVKSSGGDLFVLGRNMLEPKELIKLNEELND